MGNLEVEYVAIDTIYPNPENINVHSSKSIEKIRNSIEAFGLNTPLGVHNNYVIVGNGRYEALIQLGHEFVPIVRLDHLTPDQVVAYGIADNKTADESFLDSGLLKSALHSLEITGFDLDPIGFDASELDDILNMEEIEVKDQKDPGDTEKEVSLVVEPHIETISFDMGSTWYDIEDVRNSLKGIECC